MRLMNLDLGVHGFLKNYPPLFFVISGVVFLAACANIQIPLQPVPVTFHTFGAILLPFILPRKLAVQTMFSYFLLGAVGFPVFSGFMGGLPVLFGPKGGYYLGCLLSVCLIGFLKEKFQADSTLKICCWSLLGVLPILGLGTLVLSFFIGMKEAIRFGFMPFILLDSLKALLVLATVRVQQAVK